MSLHYVLIGALAVLFGAVMIVWPRTVARWRNSGAMSAEPTTGLVRLNRYVGGPVLIILGLSLMLLPQ